MKTAFIGLGVMGYPMAGHLARKGHQVKVYNRTQEKADRWCKEYGGTKCATPAEAAEGSEIVFVCVGNDNDVRSVVLGEKGALASMELGTLLVDHTTASPQLAEELAAFCAAKMVGFIDAPVSGGEAGAVGGTLTVMAGGLEENFAKASPVIASYAKKTVLIGGHGHGQGAKMVNQVCIAGLLQGLSEAINLGQRSGLDMKKVIEAISQGAAQSWQMVNRSDTMLAGEYNFGFAVDWMIKDLSICLLSGKKLGAELPITTLVKGRYEELSAKGRGRFDTSSLLTLLKDKK